MIETEESTDCTTEPTVECLPPFVLVEFKGHRRTYFPNPMRVQLQMGEWVLVTADRGEDAGVVRGLLDSQPLACQISEYRVLRRVTEEDVKRIEKHRQWEIEARTLCEAKISSFNIPMNLVDAEYRFDELKLTFFFTADGRVDFRDLVRNLASAFHIRIELRQIGARDEVKRCDGFGICGRQLCCISFLDTFLPITTGMAKAQGLILNPTKLSGCCGRLKCCLAFEIGDYDAEAECQEALIIDEEREDHLDRLSD